MFKVAVLQVLNPGFHLSPPHPITVILSYFDKRTPPPPFNDDVVHVQPLMVLVVMVVVVLILVVMVLVMVAIVLMVRVRVE